jgi:Flp pilus assembly protein TadB
MSHELIALVGAVGVFLLVLSLEGLLPRRRTKSKLQEAIRGADDVRLSMFEGRPLLDRLWGPLFLTWGRRLQALFKRAAQDAARLQMAGSPKQYPTVNDFYAYKILYAVGAFLVGLFAVVLLRLGVGTLWVPLVLGGLGLFWPDLQLRRLIARRTNDLLIEMSFVLDRLCVQLSVGQTLEIALIEIARRPGGLFTQELQRVVLDYTTDRVHGGLEAALNKLAARYSHVPQVTRWAGLLTGSMGRQSSQGLVPGLQSLSRMIRDQMEARALERGMRTPVFMTLILGAFILPAIGIIIGGPGVALIISQLL